MQVTLSATGKQNASYYCCCCHHHHHHQHYYYYKCHGLECCHHTVAGALYKNLDLITVAQLNADVC